MKKASRRKDSDSDDEDFAKMMGGIMQLATMQAAMNANSNAAQVQSQQQQLAALQALGLAAGTGAVPGTSASFQQQQQQQQQLAAMQALGLAGGGTTGAAPSVGADFQQQLAAMQMLQALGGASAANAGVNPLQLAQLSQLTAGNSGANQSQATNEVLQPTLKLIGDLITAGVKAGMAGEDGGADSDAEVTRIIQTALTGTVQKTALTAQTVLEMIKARSNSASNTGFPVEDFQRFMQRKKDLAIFDLSGLHQFNDAILIALVHSGTDMEVPVEEVKLAGCTEITDFGVICAIFTFKEYLKLLDLNGCCKVTDATVNFIVSNREFCKSLSELRVGGTQITNLYPIRRAFPMVKIQSGDTRHLLAVSDPTAEQSVKTQKVVILKHPSMPDLSMSKLISGNDCPVKDFSSTPWSFQSGNKQTINVNLIEVNLEYLHLFNTPGCLVLIPYPGDADDETIQSYFSSVVTQVIVKSFDFYILLCQINPSATSTAERLEQALEIAKNKRHHEIEESLEDKKLYPFDVMSKISKAFTLVSIAELSVQSELKGFKLNNVDVSSQNTKAFVEALQSAILERLSYNAAYTAVNQSIHKAMETFPNPQKKPILLSKNVTELFNKSVDKYLVNKPNIHKNILQLLDTCGQLVYLPQYSEHVVITDINWLATALDSLQTFMKEPSLADAVAAAVYDSYFVQNLARAACLLPQSGLLKWQKEMALNNDELGLFLDLLRNANLLIPLQLHRLNTRHVLEHDCSVLLCQPSKVASIDTSHLHVPVHTGITDAAEYVNAYWATEYAQSEVAYRVEYDLFFNTPACLMFTNVFARLCKFACPTLASASAVYFEMAFVTLRVSLQAGKVTVEARSDLSSFDLRFLLSEAEDPNSKAACGIEALQQVVGVFMTLIERCIMELGNDANVKVWQKLAGSASDLQSLEESEWKSKLQIQAAPFHTLTCSSTAKQLECSQCGWSVEQCTEFADCFFALQPTLAQQSVAHWTEQTGSANCKLSVVDLRAVSECCVTIAVWANAVTVPHYTMTCLNDFAQPLLIKVDFDTKLEPLSFEVNNLVAGDAVKVVARFTTVKAANKETQQAQSFSVFVNNGLYATKLVNDAQALWKMTVAIAPKAQAATEQRISLDTRRLPQLSWTIQAPTIQVGQKLEIEIDKLFYPCTVTKMENNVLTVSCDSIIVEGSQHVVRLPANAPNLHPAGFAQHLNLQDQLVVPAEYEAYLNLRKLDLEDKLEDCKGTFDWSTYLQLTQSTPVPLVTFSKAQRRDQSAILIRGFEHCQDMHCHKLFGNTPNLLMQVLERNIARCLNLLQKVVAHHILLVHILPKLDETLIRLPTVSRVHAAMRKPVLHFLCSERDCIHFVDAPGFDLKEDKLASDDEVQLLLLFTYLITLKQLDQDGLVTDSANELLSITSGKKPLPAGLVKRNLRRVLFSLVAALLGANRNYSRLIFTDMGRRLLNEAVRVVIECGKRIINSKGNSVYGNKLTFKTNPDANEAMLECAAHTATRLTGTGLTKLQLQAYNGSFRLITSLHVANNNLTDLPDKFFETMVNVRSLNLTNNKLSVWPAQLAKATHLNCLKLANNAIDKLPDDFGELSKALQQLDLSNNPISQLSVALFTCSKLLYLNVSGLLITELPDAIGQLCELRVLLASRNRLASIPSAVGKLQNLLELELVGLPWFVSLKRGEVLLRSSLDELMNAHNAYRLVDETSRERMFSEADTSRSGQLSDERIDMINNALLKSVARISDIGSCVFQLKSLRKLVVEFQAIKALPNDVMHLKHLQVLSLKNCPLLETVSAEVGKLQLETLDILNCRSLKSVPKEVAARGNNAVMSYMKKLSLGSSACRRTRLMLVGLGGVGKTSLAKCFVQKRLQQTQADVEKVTDGILITPWALADTSGGSGGGGSGKRQAITFLIWDFAGQTVYYNTHQFFFSKRGVYVLVWNIRLGHEHAGLDFWITSISCHAPKAPIVIVGTHLDEVEQHFFPEAKYRAKYAQIRGFYYVSCKDGRSLDSLVASIFDIADAEEYMNEEIPTVYTALEQVVLEAKQDGEDRVPWDTLVSWAESCGIFGRKEVIRATELLHDLGSLYFFQNQYLKNLVIINPQWIIDVLACVVRPLSKSPIKNGILQHADLPQIWPTSQYSVELHSWLLRLTEEFDLSFPMANAKSNLVPCLLSDEIPAEVKKILDEFNLQPDKLAGKRYLQARYDFRFLPAGLFNRLQVRLHQLTFKTNTMWKSGSLINKGLMKAVIMKTSDNEMIINVSGWHPENLLYLIHEVLDTLIDQSFNGVSYDYLLPCMDCVSAGISLEEVSMFSERRIRLARKRMVPFLQCTNYFHVVTISELQNLVTPEFSTGTFDQQLAGAVRELSEYRRAAGSFKAKYDIMMHYCDKDFSADTGNFIKQLRDDIAKAGITVALREDVAARCAIDNAQAVLTLKETRLIVICMSEAYSRDPACLEFVVYVTDNLHKPIQLVLLDGDDEWRKNECGLCLAAELYVDFSQRKTQYESRFRDHLLPLINSRLQQSNQAPNVPSKWPEIFLSYCWANSKKAAEAEKKPLNAEYLGWMDPRELKNILAKNNFAVWLDVEQTIKGEAGLFASISEGLKHAKLVICCISDEYALSRNCNMELTHTRNLKLPIIVCIVGKKHEGQGWRTSDTGMLVGTVPDKDTFDLRDENPQALKQLIECAKAKINVTSQEPAQQAQTQAMSVEAQVNGFHELIEIAQSKILKQLALLAAEDERRGASRAYPRLVILDMLPSADVNSDAPPFCFRFLCENEVQWHFAKHTPIPFPTSVPLAQILDSLISWAPYLARIFAILENEEVNVNIIKNIKSNEKFSHIRKLIFENAGVHDMDPNEETFLQKQQSMFERAYLTLRATAIKYDSKGQVLKQLARCLLPTRQELWLCEVHEKKACARKLNVDGESNTTQAPSDSDSAAQSNAASKKTTNLAVPVARVRRNSRASSPIGDKSSNGETRAAAGAIEFDSSQYFDNVANNRGALARVEVTAVQVGKQSRLGTQKSSRICSLM